MTSVVTKNGTFMICDEDIYIKAHMSQGEIYESHIVNGFLKQFIEKSTYIVDVGANIGCHTVSYAQFNPSCEIWAFEPQAHLFHILKHNLDVNGVAHQVHVNNCALGHAPGTLNLCPLSEVYDVHREGFSRGGVKFGRGGEVTEVRTLDSFNLPGLDYMKIDVEGAEGLVIQGGCETISKYKPIIFFEHNFQLINPKDVGIQYVPSAFEALVKLGYKQFQYVDWENYITLQ